MRTLVVAGLAAGLVALHAPAASADHADADCDFHSIHQATLTGPDQWEGLARGWAVAEDDAVTVRCVVLVNEVEVASTAPGAPTETVAVTAGRVSYTARDTDVVRLCPVITTRQGEHRVCAFTTRQIPPPWVFDLLLESATESVDAAACPALAALSPGTPPVSIDSEGDVYVNGEPVWDCPPYDIWP